MRGLSLQQARLFYHTALSNGNDLLDNVLDDSSTNHYDTAIFGAATHSSARPLTSEVSQSDSQPGLPTMSQWTIEP